MRVRMAKTSSPHTENPFDELGEQAESEADTFLEIVGPILAGFGRVTDAMLIDVTRDLAKAGHSYTVDALRSRLDGLAEAGHVRKETIFGMSEYKLNV
jgi:hypothetical protein